MRKDLAFHFVEGQRASDASMSSFPVVNQWIIYHDQKDGFEGKKMFSVKKQITDCLWPGMRSIGCKGGTRGLIGVI